MMAAYYNDIDPFCCRVLRARIADGSLPPGDVDERSIEDVNANDLRPYRQVHLFAGIGGWPYGLRLAGVPDDYAIWTASCPCQPISGAGLRRGHADKRHLWPALFRLIAECRPPIVVGEQVAGGDGREWLAGVRVDLESLGYACGGADLCAAGVGAPQIRQRLYWLANAPRERCRETRQYSEPAKERPGDGWASLGLGYSPSARRQGERDVDRTLPRQKARGLARPAMQTGIAEWNGPTVAVECQDGSRRIAAEPSLFPVASRISGDVGRLRASGNAVVPQVVEVIGRAILASRGQS